MIKTLALCCLSFMIVSVSSAQTFEGKITYQDKYVSKMPNLNDQQFTAMMGSSRTYVIKGGNYKFSTNGSLLEWQLYSNNDNKLYTKMGNSLFILWTDAGDTKDEVLKAVVNKSVINILGYQCDELVLTCKTGTQKFYFCNKLPIDGSLYAKHRFANLSEYIARTNAVPLKIVVDNPQFTLESTATAITKEKIDDNLFLLPNNAKLQKSTY